MKRKKGGKTASRHTQELAALAKRISILEARIAAIRRFGGLQKHSTDRP